VSKLSDVQSPFAHILAIGLQSELADRVQNDLGSERLRVSRFDRFDLAQSFLTEERPDLIISILLSHFPLLHVCLSVRADRRLHSIPIVALANKGTSSVQVAEVLNAGGDDCLVSPFSFPEMLLRIKVLLSRRIQPSTSTDVLNFEDLELDRVERRLKSEGRVIRLGTREFNVLLALMERPGRVHSRIQLQKAGWGRSAPEDERNVDAIVGRINKALAQVGRPLIRSIRGLGYVLGTPRG